MTCSAPTACAAGLACVTTEGSITPTVLEGTCERIELVTEAGEVCTTAGQQVCDVASGLVCVAATTKTPRPDSTCELVTDGSLDTPCAVADPRSPRGSYATILTTPCADGLYCADPSNTGLLSIAGVRIDTGGRCAMKLADGEPCMNTTMCVSGICEWNDAMSESQCGHYVPSVTPDAGVDAS